jgi:hypothetical protein
VSTLIPKNRYSDLLRIDLVKEVKMFEELCPQYPNNILYRDCLKKAQQKLINYGNFCQRLSNSKNILESSNPSKTAWNAIYNLVNRSKGSAKLISQISIDDF